jgi:hypothetical protein
MERLLRAVIEATRAVKSVQEEVDSLLDRSESVHPAIQESLTQKGLRVS